MRIYKNQYFKSDISMSIGEQNELCNPRILHMNRLPARATVIPAQMTGVYYLNKEKSDRIFSLNGDWKFALFSDSAPEGFEKDGFDTELWDNIDVPSMWQFRGYAEPTYPNVRYPFPCVPPYVLRVNPVGCYKREFFITKKQCANRAILHFEGVDNAFYVYINGVFAGFSKGSRVPAEFDITDYLNEGKNTVAVKVYTYSDATYIENQDMLMANGIFRDVYIIFSPKCALWDWEIITDTKKLSLKATLFEDCENAVARITFDGNTVEVPFKDKTARFCISPENIKLWSAEIPDLYDLTLEIVWENTVTEVHSKRVGFVLSEIVGREFRVNGKRTILRGVCRHENNAENGRSLTVDDIRKDLTLIKSNNINAIRCAHYPNNPAFYEIASELGIYVMDEGDLESHGCGVTGDQGYINKKPEWTEAFLDRVVRMAERDKNETCITFWSVGNEIGTGIGSEKCAEYLRSRKDKKPVQYHAVDMKDQDVYCTGYPNIAGLERSRLRYREPAKPILLLEYGHAMGNGPGNLQTLWDYVIEHKEFMGGFVWEFRSHGMKRVNGDGSADYLYGGDFHDTNHWTNFTLDGFCTSDGTPKPTFRELKNVYAPVIINFKEGKLCFNNIQSFLSTDGMTLVTKIYCDGKIISTKEEPMVHIEPMEQAEINFMPEYEGYDCFANISIVKNGETVSFKQFKLEANRKKELAVHGKCDCEYVCDGDKIRVSGKDFEVAFENGLPCFYKKCEKVYFDQSAEFVTYRAETDNDGIVGLYPRWIGKWEECRLHKMCMFSFSNNVSKSEDAVKITVNGMLTYDYCYTRFNLDITYSVFSDGLVLTDMTVRPMGEMPEPNYFGAELSDTKTPRLPRFGLKIKLGKDMDRVKWYGRGIEQNYEDAVSNAPVGVYELPLSEMNFEYDVPQETGNRGNVRYLQVQGGKDGFNVYGNEEFCFSYHPWELDNLRQARHRSDLKEDGNNNHLYIDYKMRGLGSHSCGPDPEQKFDFEPHDFQFVFAFNGETKDEAKYFLKDFGIKTQKLSDAYIYNPLESEREAVECKA